jgi:hypothetical protein
MKKRLALEIRHKSLPCDQSDNAASLNNIGAAYDRQEYEKASIP